MNKRKQSPVGSPSLSVPKRGMTMAEYDQKLAERLIRERTRMIEGARLLANADRTDPFAFRRAMTHIDNGVASYHRPAGKMEIGGSLVEIESGEAFYKATPYREARKALNGTDYYVLRYANVARP